MALTITLEKGENVRTVVKYLESSDDYFKDSEPDEKRGAITLHYSKVRCDFTKIVKILAELCKKFQVRALLFHLEHFLVILKDGRQVCEPIEFGDIDVGLPKEGCSVMYGINDWLGLQDASTYLDKINTDYKEIIRDKLFAVYKYKASNAGPSTKQGFTNVKMVTATGQRAYELPLYFYLCGNQLLMIVGRLPQFVLAYAQEKLPIENCMATLEKELAQYTYALLNEKDIIVHIKKVIGEAT